MSTYILSSTKYWLVVTFWKFTETADVLNRAGAVKLGIADFVGDRTWQVASPYPYDARCTRRKMRAVKLCRGRWSTNGLSGRRAAQQLNRGVKKSSADGERCA